MKPSAASPRARGSLLVKRASIPVAHSNPCTRGNAYSVHTSEVPGGPIASALLLHIKCVPTRKYWAMHSNATCRKDKTFSVASLRGWNLRRMGSGTILRAQNFVPWPIRHLKMAKDKRIGSWILSIADSS